MSRVCDIHYVRSELSKLLPRRTEKKDICGYVAPETRLQNCQPGMRCAGQPVW